MIGKPTKRIVRILRVECAAGNRLTYEKELLNSKKIAIFTKRIIPASPMFFPYDPNDNISCMCPE